MKKALWKFLAVGLACAALLSGTWCTSGAAYHLLKKVVLGGQGGWDYLTCDSKARRIYISRGSHVMVVDADSFTVAGDIPGTNGVHGIALATPEGRGFVSDGADSSVSVFELGSLKTLGKVPVGIRPDAIVYDPATHRVFTFNAGSRDATALDAASMKVVGTVPLAGKPEFAAPDGAGRMFVNIEDSSLVRVMDTRGLKVLASWPVAPGEEPSGLALDARRGHIYSGCSNQLMTAMNSATGSIASSVAIGKGVDAVAYDEGTGLIFSSNGEGNLTVASESKDGKLVVRETVTTEAGARTMALDEKTHRVYLVTAQFGPAPEPTAEHPHPRRPMLPGTFELLVMAP